MGFCHQWPIIVMLSVGLQCVTSQGRNPCASNLFWIGHIALAGRLCWPNFGKWCQSQTEMGYGLCSGMLNASWFAEVGLIVFVEKHFLVILQECPWTSFFSFLSLTLRIHPWPSTFPLGNTIQDVFKTEPQLAFCLSFEFGFAWVLLQTDILGLWLSYPLVTTSKNLMFVR